MTMKSKYLILAVLLSSTNVAAQLIVPENSKSNPDYDIDHLGPWTITTLSNDNGRGLLILDRENWGAVSMDSILGKRQVLIQGKVQPSTNTQFIEVSDTDKNGEFDVIKISNTNPEFELIELRLIDGVWQMKTILEWHEIDKNN